MEQDTLQRRSANTIKNMGVNSYSQIVSAFRAQGDLTEEKLTILPVLQNVLGISRERHTAEVKRALYDEQLSEIASSIDPSSNTTNWEIEANYACPTVVHHPPSTKYIQLAEQLLQTTPPTTIIQYPQPTASTKLNHDLQQLVRHEMKDDGVINATQQQLNQTSKQNINSFNSTDVNGSKVVRLVRAKQATKRKSSLDTLIEVVQKELLRVNGQNSSSASPSPSRYAPTRSFPSSKLQNRISQSTLTPHHSIISSVLPSSHPASLISQATHSFKVARKREMINFNNPKRIFSLHQRNKSFHDDGDERKGFMEYDDAEPSTEDLPSGPENIEEIVRDTVDKLVAITLLNNAPYIVNMLTPIPDNGNNTESKISGNPLATNNTSLRTLSISSTANDIRNSMHQTSPNKVQSCLSQQQQHQQIHHPQLIIQPATTTPISTIQGTNTSTLFVAPRILNFQTVGPKPTTNIQIGNTKIILVSPSNITQHLPHSTTPMSSTSTSQQQQANFASNSPVKLVKFTTTNNNSSITTRATALPLNSTQTSTLTLPKNVQIVIPSQTPSPMQLTRTLSDDLSKSLPPTTTITAATTFRPMTLTTRTVDQIPQAAQEVTITTSPTTSPPLTANTTDLQQQTTLAPSTDRASPIPNIQQQLVSTLARTSPTQEEMIKSVALNFPQQQIPRHPSTHGPMIYRMTSVNPNVPVFRVRAATAPTSAPVMNKSIKTDTKPISVTTATNVCYESKPPHNTSTTNGSVSVLACFKTTKKRNKERAIMPRPSITDSNDTSQELQQRLNTIGAASHLPSTPNINTSLLVSGDITNNNSSPDYRQQFSLTPTRLVQQTSLSSSYSDDTPSNILSSSVHEANNDTTTSSSNSIPIARFSTTESNPMSRVTSPPVSPIPSSLHSTPGPVVDDKSIQDIDEETGVKPDETEPMMTDLEMKKRLRDDSDNESWTVAFSSLLRDILSQPDFHSLDVNSQQTLTSHFDLLQSDLLNDDVSSPDECYRSVLEIKQKLFAEEHLDRLFHLFETEFSNLCKRTNEQKRTKQQ